MAISKVNTADENSGGGRKKYTGLTVMDVVIANPTKEQMIKMGMKAEKDPAYFSVIKEGEKEISRLIVKFFVHKDIGEGESKHSLLINHAIFMEARYSYSKEGKAEIIDKFGKSAYVDAKEFKAKTAQVDWMDMASAKVAMVGETALIGFIRNLANSGKEDEILIEHLSPDGKKNNLFNPNGLGASEINATLAQIKKANGAKLKFLLGVRSEKGKNYQDIFPYNIGRVFADATYFHKELISIYKRNKAFFAGRDYGPIDLGTEKANQEQYSLRIWEGEEEEEAAAPGLPGAMQGPKASKGSEDGFDDFEEVDDMDMSPASEDEPFKF